MDIMTINLAKGHFNAVNGHEVLKANFNDLELPNKRYMFLAKQYESRLPDISTAYQTCIDAGMGQGELIDTLIQLYYPLRFFHIGDYEKMAIVLGFIGMRGSGKTCSAVMVAVSDFLLRGMPVWSNVPITVRVVYRDAEKIYTSNNLDDLDMLDLTEDYGGGCVLYDEVNMEAAESTRYASGANLKFAYAMQQIRKRQLSLIWTCQGWSWIDNRLRWQTDFCIACRDAGLEKKKYDTNGIGDKAVWRVHDLSGTSGKFDYDYELRHRYLTDYLISSMLVWLRPWWHAYNTGQLQGQRDYIREYKVAQAQKEKSENNKIILPRGISSELPEQTITLDEAVDTIIATSDNGRIYCNRAWECLNTNDRALQTKVGRIFNSRGYEKSGNSKYGYYWKKIEQEV